MKKILGLVVFLLLLAPALLAQEHYTEVPSGLCIRYADDAVGSKR